MNIGFLVSSLEGGGAERVVVTVANHLSLNGYSICIYLFDRRKPAYSLNKNIRIRVCGKSKKNIRIARIIDRTGDLIRYLREDNTELLFAYMISMIPYALVARIRTGCKVVCSERANPRVHSKMFQWIIRYLSPLCDGFIFQTEGAKEYYPKKTQKKAIVIANSAPLYLAKRKRPDDIRICSVGRLHSDKDFRTLIQAFHLFCKNYRESTLTIFGDGNQKEELVDLSKQLGIAEKVIFKGFVSNILEEISQYTMFVFSSAAEGMPNALLEGMSVGLPCISTDCPYGPDEIIEDGKNGWLVPVGDAAAMADRMKWVVENAEEAERIGNNARYVQEKYSIQSIMLKYINYIKEIMKA